MGKKKAKITYDRLPSTYGKTQAERKKLLDNKEAEVKVYTQLPDYKELKDRYPLEDQREVVVRGLKERGGINEFVKDFGINRNKLYYLTMRIGLQNPSEVAEGKEPKFTEPRKPWKRKKEGYNKEQKRRQMKEQEEKNNASEKEEFGLRTEFREQGAGEYIEDAVMTVISSLQKDKEYEIHLHIKEKR